MTGVAPCAARERQIFSPSPPVAPVTRITLLFSSIMGSIVGNIELLNSYDYAEAVSSDMEAIDHHILFLPGILLQFLPLQVAHDGGKTSRASKSLSYHLLD